MSVQVLVGSLEALLGAYSGPVLRALVNQSSNRAGDADEAPSWAEVRRAASYVRAQLCALDLSRGRPGEEPEEVGLHQLVDTLDAAGLDALAVRLAAHGDRATAELIVRPDLILVPLDLEQPLAMGTLTVGSLPRMRALADLLIEEFALTEEELECGREGVDRDFERVIYNLGVLRHGMAEADRRGLSVQVAG